MPVKDAAKYAERPLSGIKTLVLELVANCHGLVQNNVTVVPDDLIEKIGLFEALCQLAGLDEASSKITGQEDNLKRFLAHFNRLKMEFSQRADEAGIREAREKYLVEFGHVFRYEFSDDDISDIQRLINELRARISQGEFFNDKHKARLLKKLEELQAALHKRVANLDKLYALVGEGAVSHRNMVKPRSH